MAKNSLKSVPKVLEERLLLDKKHRRVIDKIEELSPKDLGYVLIDPTMGYVPTSFNLARELGIKTSEVQSRIAEIMKI